MPNYLKGALFFGAIAFLAWTFMTPSKPDIDMAKVLERTNYALGSFSQKLQEKGTKKVTKEHMAELTGHIQKSINQTPVLHKSPIGVALHKDSSFEGYEDNNLNNVKDSGENKLFKVEIDFEGQRLLASSGDGSGGFTGMGLGTGLLAGMLMGRMMGNQRAAGVGAGAFSNRRVTPKSAYSRNRAQAQSRARSRSRSGGRFGGK